MPKKSRPITVLTTEELDALDDATFAKLAVDKERLHQALQDPSTIRSGQALSIAKNTDQNLNDPQDPPGSGTDITSVPDQLPAQGTVIQGDATSVRLTMMMRPPRQTKI